MKEEEIFDAPPLPNLERLSAIYLLSVVFQKAGRKDRVAYGLAINFIRLVDQAVRTYVAARESMIEFTHTHDHFAWDKLESGCSQFELCVQSIRRAVAMANGIVRYDGTPEVLRQILPPEKTILPNHLFRPITNLRNASQHLDRELERGRIGPGDAVSLVPGRDALELGTYRLNYDHIVKAIGLLHPFAEAVSKFQEEPCP